MTGSATCQYKYETAARGEMRMNFLRCQLKGEILTENILTGAVQASPFFLPRLWILTTRWYTWCKSALAVVVHLVHIGTPLTKATLTSTSLQNCYSDTLTQLVPTPNQRELLIDCSAWARQWHIVLCSKIRSYMPEIATSPRTNDAKLASTLPTCSLTAELFSRHKY